MITPLAINRRGFLRGVGLAPIALVAAGAVANSPADVAEEPPQYEDDFVYFDDVDDLSAIVTKVLRTRSRQIAENAMQSNELFARLSR